MGFLDGIARVGDNGGDLADDEVFREEIGGEGKDGGAGVKGGVVVEIGDGGNAVFDQVAALATVFELGVDFNIAFIEGRDDDDGGLDGFDDTDESVAGNDGLTGEDAGKVEAGEGGQIVEADELNGNDLPRVGVDIFNQFLVIDGLAQLFNDDFEMAVFLL